MNNKTKIFRSIIIYIFLTMSFPIYLSAQSGWQLQESGTSTRLESVFAINEDTCFVVGGNGTVLRTNNGGEAWEILDQNINTDFRSCWFINKFNGWIAGSHGVILRTIDSGNNWQIVGNFSSNFEFSDIQFTDDLTGWVVGNYITLDSVEARIYKSTDGGQSWEIQTHPGWDPMFSRCSFINSSVGWISGLNGLYYTSDGGLIWTHKSGMNEGPIQFIDTAHGWAASFGGSLISRTVDGGNSWDISSVYSLQGMGDLHFINKDIGWLVGSPLDSIAKTIDGGQSWYFLPTGISGNWSLRSVQFVNNDIGWAVGDNGVILSTKDGGGFLNPSETPTFRLYQNFPNPFNLTTTISYSIQQSGFITLKVYDILGREIQTLVNEYQEANTYYVRFSAINLSGGIYLCRLQTGDHIIITKKMLLIK